MTYWRFFHTNGGTFWTVLITTLEILYITTLQNDPDYFLACMIPIGLQLILIIGIWFDWIDWYGKS